MSSQPDRIRRILTLAVDEEYYFERYPDVRAAGQNAVGHYAADGWRERRDPTAWFSTDSYLRKYPELEAEGINPLYHFLVYGMLRSEETLAAELGDASRETVEAHFDAPYYLLQNPDVAAAGLDPFEHYIITGWREGRNPSPLFRTREYLTANPDVDRSGSNPFVHYVSHGMEEGRLPAPFSLAESAEKKAIEAEFDPEYYQRMYADVADHELEPLEHYLHVGWRDGRNPNAEFSTNEYLEIYPDVAAAGWNPFVHYLTKGRAEGRVPRYNTDFRSGMLIHGTSLEKRLANIRSQFREIASGSADDLRRAAEMVLLKRSAFVLSVSHDDYVTNLGGVQLCVRREASALQGAGYDHFHLFPVIPLPCNELERDDYNVGVIVNGVFLGNYLTSTVAEVVSEAAVVSDATARAFTVHSLLGHNAHAIARIFRAARLSRGYFWIHDYGTVCSGWNLLRDDVVYCGAPPQNSMACSICTYGETRNAQAAQAGALLDDFETTVLAPSEFTLANWKRASGREPKHSAVVPHCEFVFRKIDERSLGSPAGPVRIAYLGFPASHKGWPVFAKMAEALSSDSRYEFHHIGTSPQPGVPLRFTSVTTTETDPSAMIRAVEALEIDAALVWSLCPETFCFTAHEAFAGGAAVITNHDSGNVAKLVEERTAKQLGVVLEDVSDLERALASGALHVLRRGNRRVELFDLRYGTVTAELLMGIEREGSLL